MQFLLELKQQKGVINVHNTGGLEGPLELNSGKTTDKINKSDKIMFKNQKKKEKIWRKKIYIKLHLKDCFGMEWLIINTL